MRSHRRLGQSSVEQALLLLAAVSIFVVMFGFAKTTLMGHYKGGSDSVNQGLRYRGWRP